MKIVLDENAILPTRAHRYDAGLDLYAPESHIVRRWSGESIPTGVHIEIPHGYAGLIKTKSGMNTKHDLTCEGVIDSEFTGSIVVRLYNHGSQDYIVERGDKIAQLVLVPVGLPELEIVDRLSDTERGSNGFGSTGR